MDTLEKKLRELYQKKKQQDEKLFPRFDTFWEPAYATALKNRKQFLRIAASVAAIIMVAALLYYLTGLNRQAKKADQNYNVNLQLLPSQKLLNQTLTTTYIWQWKAPTDKLLDAAIRSINK